MSTKTNKKSSKKVIMLSAVALLLVACITMSTMAWLSLKDSVTNTFTIGNFTKPNTDDEETTPDPQQPDPDDQPAEPSVSLGGYIIEPSWDVSEGAVHKLIPSGSLFKDPYVGIGKGSEDAVIYVYVENTFKNQSVYFKLNDVWEAVADKTEAGPEADTYVSGVFKYVGGDAGILKASADKDSWTDAPVFSSVQVKDTANIEDLDVEEKTIEVSCFIHQAYDGEGNLIPADNIETAAIGTFGI